MDRRKAIAFAAAATAVSFAGALAVGANVGLFGLTPVPKAAALPIRADAVAAASDTPGEVRYVDVPVTIAVPAGSVLSLPVEAVDGNDQPTRPERSATADSRTADSAVGSDTVGSPTTSTTIERDDDHPHESTTSTSVPERDDRDD